MKKHSRQNVVGKIKSHHDFMWSYFKDFLIALFRPAMAFLIFLGLLMVNVFASLFYYIEAESNPQIHHYIDALYFSMSTMTTVGFGDISPVTFQGKILTMFMMLIGTGLFVSYTAVISSTIIHIEQYKKSLHRTPDDSSGAEK
jgi:voltage-gated potassium channel Kch